MSYKIVAFIFFFSLNSIAMELQKVSYFEDVPSEIVVEVAKNLELRELSLLAVTNKKNYATLLQNPDHLLYITCHMAKNKHIFLNTMIQSAHGYHNSPTAQQVFDNLYNKPHKLHSFITFYFQHREHSKNNSQLSDKESALLIYQGKHVTNGYLILFSAIRELNSPVVKIILHNKLNAEKICTLYKGDIYRHLIRAIRLHSFNAHKKQKMIISMLCSLKKAGLNLNLLYNEETLLMRACENNLLPVITYLAENIDNINLSNSRGTTALDYAYKYYNEDSKKIIKILQDNGASINHVAKRSTDQTLRVAMISSILLSTVAAFSFYYSSQQ